MFATHRRPGHSTGRLITGTTAALVLGVLFASGCGSDTDAASDRPAATSAASTAVDVTAPSSTEESTTTAPAVPAETSPTTPATPAPATTVAATMPPAPSAPATPASNPTPSTAAAPGRSVDVEAFCTDDEAFGIALMNDEYDVAFAVMTDRAAELTAIHPSEAADIADCLQAVTRGG